MNCPELTEQEFDQVYDFIDRIPLSRPRKNINRDFSDGVLLPEVISAYLPNISPNLQLQSSNNVTIKQNNWSILNQKLLKKINFQVSKMDIDHIITETPGAIERVLKQLKGRLEGWNKKKEEPNKELVQLRKIAQNPRFREKIEEMDGEIQELKRVVDVLENKIGMMGQLVDVKDRKIEALVAKLELAGML